MENSKEQPARPITIRVKRKPTPPVAEPQPPTASASLAEMYIASLSEKELMAYKIAKNHLESTFSLEKQRVHRMEKSLNN
jgi:hypothetical protein